MNGQRNQVRCQRMKIWPITKFYEIHQSQCTQEMAELYKTCAVVIYNILEIARNQNNQIKLLK